MFNSICNGDLGILWHSTLFLCLFVIDVLFSKCDQAIVTLIFGGCKLWDGGLHNIMYGGAILGQHG